jgi:NitT/TauT family transport system ATP-binding protein
VSSPPAGQAILDVEQLDLWFPNGNGGLQVLKNISFSVRPREFIAVLGPSGCGKSSLLRVLAGLLAPSSGQVRYDDSVTAGQVNLQPQVGFVFQHANLMPWRTVHENIALPLELQGQPQLEIANQAQDMIELVGLTGFADSLPAELSGGMAQRVALARALIHDPEILLLDEPFGALDALTRDRMGRELLRIWQLRRKTVVMVTHDIHEALFLADRVLVFSPRPGQLRLDLPVELDRPRSDAMRYTPEFGHWVREVRTAIRE